MASALVVVDVQNDYCEGGAMAVKGGADVARAISRHLREASYSVVVATRDYHVDPGEHFAMRPDHKRSWPVHCVAGMKGADFFWALDIDMLDAVFSKGAYAAADSGFEGTSPLGEPLAIWLKDHGVDEVTVVGLTFDGGVRATALDAVREGFRTTVPAGLTVPTSTRAGTAAAKALQAAGVTLLRG